MALSIYSFWWTKYLSSSKVICDISWIWVLRPNQIQNWNRISHIGVFFDFELQRKGQKPETAKKEDEWLYPGAQIQKTSKGNVTTSKRNVSYITCLNWLLLDFFYNYSFSNDFLKEPWNPQRSPRHISGYFAIFKFFGSSQTSGESGTQMHCSKCNIF